MSILFIWVSISLCGKKGVELSNYLHPSITKMYDSIVHYISYNVTGKQSLPLRVSLSMRLPPHSANPHVEALTIL